MSSKKSTPLSLPLADYVSRTTFGSLPVEVVDQAKLGIMDFLGVALAGSMTLASRKTVDFVLGADAKKECTIIGSEMRTSSTLAALANGTMSRNVELDSHHNASLMHPSVTVIPAALALAECRKSMGKDLIASIVAGYEISLRLGEATSVGLISRGFSVVSACGVFGAAAAASRILNLNSEQIANAFGIAGSLASGLREGRRAGAMVKAFQAGRAAEAGVTAALLAEDGFTGPTTIIEGEHGFCRAFSDSYSLEGITKNLGKTFKLLETSYKIYACCRCIHPGIDAVLEITHKNKIRSDEIEEVLVRLPEKMYETVMLPADTKYRPKTLIDAQFSLPFYVALSILDEASVRVPIHYLPNILNNNKLLDFAAKVKAKIDLECEGLFPRCFPSIVEVKTTRGKVYRCKIEYSKGDPECPLSRDELDSKFNALSSRVLGEEKTIKVLEILNKLDEVKIATLTELLR